MTGEVSERALKFTEDVSSLHLNEEFSDVIFIINGEKLYAHKAILAVRSEYFKKLLYGDMRETKQSEIVIEDVSSPEVFKSLLQYIYTGDIKLETSNIEHALDVLMQAHKYCMHELQSIAIEKVKKMVNLENAPIILNYAISFNIKELKNTCFLLIDQSVSQFLRSKNFFQLTQKSFAELLTRDTFYAPELEIFKALVQWLQNNQCEDSSSLISLIRLGWISVHSLVSVVKPTGLVSAEALLNAIAQAENAEPKTTRPRGRLSLAKNVAARSEKAEVLNSKNNSLILDEKSSSSTVFECHKIGDENGIIIKLGEPHMINVITMMLYCTFDICDVDNRWYSYYIEITNDLHKWKRIVDYSRCPCSGYQTLSFNEEVALYIKIVGTCSTSQEFLLASFSASYLLKPPQTVRGFIKPDYNVAHSRVWATVIEGINTNFLINKTDVDLITSNYAYHSLDSSEKIAIQFNQPYMISDMLMVLYESSSYTYYVEVSADKNNWTVVANIDQSCELVQHITFPEQVVVCIRIVGTYSSVNDNEFRLRYFESPAVNLRRVLAAVEVSDETYFITNI